MNTFVRAVTLSGGMFLCSLATAQSPQSAMDTGTSSMSRSEAAQLSQDMSPQARSQLARREAYAAYNEALSTCKTMDRAERKGCAAEAKKNLRQDLSYAKAIRNQDTSVGGSGAYDNSGSGASSSSSLGGATGARSASSPINGHGMSSSGGSASSDLSGRNGSLGMGATSGASGMSGMSGTSSTGATGSTSSSGSTMGQPDLSQGDLKNDRPSADMSSEKLSSAEKKQFVQSFTPQAQYNLSKREAHAAYAEALKACKGMAKSERTACTKEARSTLQQDLAYAKSQLQQDSSGASSGSGTDSGVSGSGK